MYMDSSARGVSIVNEAADETKKNGSSQSCQKDYSNDERVMSI
jgi:hypothetical protein